MAIYINIDIGTHQVTAEPFGTSLELRFTWHERILMQAWTFDQISAAAALTENDSDYVRAERDFILLLGFDAVLKGP